MFFCFFSIINNFNSNSIFLIFSPIQFCIHQIFIDTEKKDVPLGHGLTGEIENNGLREPIFETSEVTGAIENYAIETIKDENGNDIDVVAGSGYIFSQRYPAFLKWVRENYALGKVCTSVEIMGLATKIERIKRNDSKIRPLYKY